MLLCQLADLKRHSQASYFSVGRCRKYSLSPWSYVSHMVSTKRILYMLHLNLEFGILKFPKSYIELIEGVKIWWSHGFTRALKPHFCTIPSLKAAGIEEASLTWFWAGCITLLLSSCICPSQCSAELVPGLSFSRGKIHSFLLASFQGGLCGQCCSSIL